jgi:hypothetical protein
LKCPPEDAKLKTASADPQGLVRRRLGRRVGEGRARAAAFAAAKPMGAYCEPTVVKARLPVDVTVPLINQAGGAGKDCF